MLVVLGVTAALVAYPPPSSLAAGPFSAQRRDRPAAPRGDRRSRRASGANEIHLYLLDAHDRRARSTATKELHGHARAARRSDIGPIAGDARARPDPATTSSTRCSSCPRGDWRLQVTSRVSEFDQYERDADGGGPMIDVLLLLAPALALLCALLLGRYPGERAIATLAARRPAARRGRGARGASARPARGPRPSCRAAAGSSPPAIAARAAAGWMTDAAPHPSTRLREEPYHEPHHHRRDARARAPRSPLPAAAGAHVTLQPTEAPAGGFARLDVRVPNERDDAATRKVAVQMPPGFASASLRAGARLERSR